MTLPDKQIAAARLTMEDIAREAGVSTITVSRALANNPLVRQATRDRIREIAADRGYQFNTAARNLRLQKTSTIAVVIEMLPTTARPMSDPYPLALLGGIIQDLSTAGYNATLSTADNFIRRPPTVDAVILLGQGMHDDAVASIERCNLPLVVWGSARNDASHIIVGSDNMAGGVLAAQRFADLGRKGAIFLGDTEYTEIADRLDGFAARFMGQGGELLATLPCEFTLEGGMVAMDTALDRHAGRIDAVFCASDNIAMGAIRALAKRGVLVPDQVSVIGFDDAAAASLFMPSLTTIRQDWHECGRLLARKSLSLAQGERVASEMMPVQIAIRSS